MMNVARKLVSSLAGAGLAVALMAGTSAQGVVVNLGEEGDGGYQGYMNVFELPANGGAYLWGSGWGIADLTAVFDDGANTLTLGPNVINDINEYWYQDTCGCAADPTNPGGPGQAGNKLMEASLYYEVTDVYNGQTVTFEGEVLSNTYTDAHEASIFIRDFAPDYSSLNETVIPVTPGPFSISLATDPGAGRHVQWGVRTLGENVWITDVAPFGNVVFATVPEPASLALLGLGGLAIAGKRRK